MKQILFAVVFLMLLMSCNHLRRKHDIKNTIDKMIGKNVKVPDSLKIFYSNNYSEKPRDFQIQIYSCIDGNCSLCVRDFALWNEFIMKNEMANEVNFNFLISSNNYCELEKYFNKKKYTFPFIKDFDSKMIKVNELPENKAYHTFLAINNRIVLVGNPMHSEKIKELYLRTINKELFNEEIVGLR